MTNLLTKPCDDCKQETSLRVDHRGKPRAVCLDCQYIRSLGTLNLTILTGNPFNWDQAEHDYNAYMGAGRDIAAGFVADPGCVRCPECRANHWREGQRVRCANSKCGHEWEMTR